MLGKVCMVTGATAGIGQITAITLAAMGADMVIVGRNFKKATKTVSEIKALTGNPNVTALLADFSDLDQVRKLAVDFQQQHTQLDVLVNNAGAFFNNRQRTPYGVEQTFLVNHLAPFLLTKLLLEMLKTSAPARIINVSSDAHRSGSMNHDDLEFNRFYFGMLAYGRSKLANVLFTYELSRRLENSGVTVNALHPGHIATDIWRTNFGILGKPLKWMMSNIALTPEQGADNSIYLASSPEVEGITGKYFEKREAVVSSPRSNDPELAKQLWEISERLVSGQ